jgi:hypothetical protein
LGVLIKLVGQQRTTPVASLIPMQSNLRILTEKLIAKLYRLFDIFVFDEPLQII